jgi:multidrug resistance efflux pump/ABC-type multidrug transport system fused ATPase/permease subunit
MYPLERWFKLAFARGEQAVFLEDALLSDRFYAYAVFRLRFFMGSSLVTGILHLIGFTILAFIFSGKTLVFALIVNTVSSLVNAWWWGALESMREQIRTMRHKGKTYLIAKIISPWFYLAILCSLFILTLTISWILLDTLRPTQRFELIHLFVFAVGLQLSLSILLRTYHSTVYAIRRIYRPFFSIVGIQLLGLFSTLLAWPVFGVWSYPLMLIPVSLITNILTYIYVSRMYRVIGFPPIRGVFGQMNTNSLHSTLNKEFFFAGFSYASLRLDNLIIISLFYGAYNNANEYDLFIFFYLISPFTHASFGWAQLFYFDLKRLDLELLQTLKKKFEKFVWQVSWFMGGFFCVLACIFATLFLQRNLGILYLFLVFFFLFRSHLAFFQIRAFAAQRYSILIIMGIIVMIYVSWISSTVSSEMEKFAFYVLFLLPLMFYLAPRFFSNMNPEANELMRSLPDWLSGLKHLDQQVRVRSVCISRNAKNSQVRQIAETIMHVIPHGSMMTIIGNYRITWYEPKIVSKPPSDTMLLHFGAGLIEKVLSIPYTYSGFESLRSAQQNGLFGGIVNKQHLEVDRSYKVAEIERRFCTRFPNGIFIDLNKKEPVQLHTLSSVQRRELMYGAIQYSKYLFRRFNKMSFDVTALLVAGDIRLIFGIPQCEMITKRQSWKSYINGINVCSALGAKIYDNEKKNMLSFTIKRALYRFIVLASVLAIWYIPIHDRAAGSFQLHSSNRSEVRAPASGFLRAIKYDEGSVIKAGTLIARLEVHDLTSQIARKRSEIEEAEAVLHSIGSNEHLKHLQKQRDGGGRFDKKKGKGIAGKMAEYRVEYEFARENYHWMKTLFEKNVVGEREFKRAKKNYHVWESQYQQVQDELEAKQALIDRLDEELRYFEKLKNDLELYSPVDGIIVTPRFRSMADRYYEEGDLILEVADPSQLEVEISLSEQEIAYIKPGQKVLLKIFALPYKNFRATVNRIAPVIQNDKSLQTDQLTVERSVIVYCLLDEFTPELLIGMGGYARIYLERRSFGSFVYHRLMRFIRTEFWW